MKKKSFILVAFLCCTILKLSGQSSTAFTTYCAGCYLGWGGTTNPLYIKTNNATAITVLGTNQYVGIGTTPAVRLEVFDGANPQLRLSESAFNFTDFQNSSAYGLTIYDNEGLVAIGQVGNAFSHIKVGIGTEPSYSNTWNLTIHSDDAVSVVTQYTNQNTGATQTSGLVTGIVSTGDAIFQNNENLRDTHFYTTNGTTTERMRITFNGNIGVGSITATPAQTLDVFGSARIRTMTTDNTKTDVVVRDGANGDLYINSQIGTNANNAWFITGNTGLGGTNYLGTTDGADVIFKTSSTERARIVGTTAGSVLAGNIGIGISQPTAKVHSEYSYSIGTTPETNGRFFMSSSGTAGSATTFTSVEGTCLVSQGTQTTKNIGGDFTSKDATTNYGVRSLASSTSTNSTNNYGIYSAATNASANTYAGYFSGSIGNGGASTDTYGIYSEASGTSGAHSYGVYCKNSGSTGTDWALFVNGRDFSPGGAWTASDQQFKKDIQSLKHGLALIEQLKPYSYHFDRTGYPQLNFDSTLQFGLLAQDVENVLPNLVTDVSISPTIDSNGNQTLPGLEFKAMSYVQLIPLLIDAFKEEDSIVHSLQTQLNSCCNASQGFRSSDPNGNNSSGTQTVDLKSSTANYLGQSVPNPHATQCTVPYRIDPTVTKAEIVFSDQLGAEISRVEIVTRGEGQLTVLSSQLEDGLYTYSLIADGKLIDTKKMVKQH